MLKHIAAALRHGPEDATEKLLFIALLEHADKHGVCWPSRRLLGEYTQASQRTITRKLRLLEVKGWIQRKQRFQSSTVFRLNINRLNEREAQERAYAHVPKGWQPFQDEKPQPIENKDDGQNDHKDGHFDHKDGHFDHKDGHSDHLNPLKNPFKKKEPPAVKRDLFSEWLKLPLKDKPTFQAYKDAQKGAPSAR